MALFRINDRLGAVFPFRTLLTACRNRPLTAGGRGCVIFFGIRSVPAVRTFLPRVPVPGRNLSSGEGGTMYNDIITS